MRTATLRLKAVAQLDGVGDPSQQWEEWTGTAFHVRRRLTVDEQESVGEAKDCRGTPEWGLRYSHVATLLPAQARRIAVAEGVAE